MADTLSDVDKSQTKAIYTDREIADMMGTSLWRVRKMMDSGLLPVMKFGQMRRMTAGQWQEVLDGKWTGVAA